MEPYAGRGLYKFSPELLAIADGDDVCYYESSSVLIHHKAINDCHAACSNLFKNRKSLRDNRAAKDITDDADDRVVVADVLVEFFRRMVQYSQKYPTIASRMHRYNPDPYSQGLGMLEVDAESDAETIKKMDTDADLTVDEDYFE